MNERKAAMLEQNLTSTARKVFAVVPSQEAWSSQAIYGELVRSGRRLDFSMVEGCLNSLVQDGLVKEVYRGVFQRAEVKAPCANDDPCGEPLTTTPPCATTIPGRPASPDGSDAFAYMVAPMKDTDLLGRMAALSARLRTVADEVDELALQAAAEIERAKASASRFDQLKTLLKDAIA